MQKDTILVGIAASPGYAIGESFLLQQSKLLTPDRSIAEEEVDGQVQAFLEAVEMSKRELLAVKSSVSAPELLDHLYIIDTHLLILEDQMMIGNTISLIKEKLINAEGALKRNLDKFRKVFEAIEDEYLRERFADIDSVGERLLRNLIGESTKTVAGIGSESIVVAHELSPADTMQIDKTKVLGFATEAGGRTSHTAIVARSMGLPAVVGLEGVTRQVFTGMPFVIDGVAGTVILNPSEATLEEYFERKRAYESAEKELLCYKELPTETLDGYRLSLKSNVEFIEEVPLALALGSEGIGLFRSEFLYLNRSEPPSEEEQFKVYRDIVEAMAPHSVTIRTLDVGGDKFVPEINLVEEANPALGLRAIRFSLMERRLFKTQLRAMLRASAYGHLRVLFPMISGVAEIRQCKACLEEVRQELEGEGVEFERNLEVGVMIETPAATLIADLLAKEVDFFSVGTNDLIQYCLAVDRCNEQVAHLYEPLHPAHLRALKMICDAAKKEGIKVGMCGEMAGEPLYSLILLALGFEALSVNSPALPRVKRILRAATMTEAKKMLDEVLKVTTASDVAELLEKRMSGLFPDIFSSPRIKI